VIRAVARITRRILNFEFSILNSQFAPTHIGPQSCRERLIEFTTWIEFFLLRGVTQEILKIPGL